LPAPLNKSLGLMADSRNIISTRWNESNGTCDCCGGTSKTIRGDLSIDDHALAVYYVSWTTGAPEHKPRIDFVVGAWGEGTDPAQRVLISLLFRPASDGGSFMVVDADDKLATYRKVCGRAMRRAEVLGTPLGQEIFALVDALWASDPRIAEVDALNHVA
jgi:hypothetical protein